MSENIRLDGITRDVLDAFDDADGYGTTGHLVDASGRSRPTVSKRLDRLRSAGCIEYHHKPTAFWVLVDDPRDD